MEVFDQVTVMILYLTLLFLPRDFAVFDGGRKLGIKNKMWDLQRHEGPALDKITVKSTEIN